MSSSNTVSFLTASAQKALVESLERFGNKISIPHRKALFTLVESFSHMAEGQLLGRWAFPIPTGCGKTRAIIEWAAAVSKLKAPYSMVVSASRIEALCTMKRDMVKNGIPEEQIGLIYSPVYLTDAKGHATKKLAYSEPFTENNEDRPFLLCSHQLIRSRESNQNIYNVYKGDKRSLCVYDESLLISDIEHFPVESVTQALGGWINNFRFSQDADRHASILKWMTERLDRIAYHFQNYDAGQTNELPEPCFRLTPEESSHYVRFFLQKGDGVMADFLAINGLPLRLIRHGKVAIISYRIVIPDELKNMIVLDASYPIRKLEQTDITLRNAEELPSCKNFQVKFDALKRFDHVTLYRMTNRGSRTATAQHRTKMKRLMQDVVAVIKSIPANEGILVFVYKERHNKNPKRLLELTMEEAGVKRQNISIETWGNETSLNSYSDRQHVILVGILHRDLSELEAHYVGQKDNISMKSTADDIKAISLSERVHCAYQAFSRGCCRVMESEGQAKAMTGYVVEYEDSLEDLLSQVMPGVQWKTWKPVYSDLVEHGKLTKTIAAKLVTYLSGLSTDVAALSARRVWSDLNLTGANKDTRSKAVTIALSQLSQWKQVHQWFRRVDTTVRFSNRSEDSVPYDSPWAVGV